MKLKDAMAEATKFILEEENCACVADINHGFCDVWVGEVLNRLDEGILAIGWWLDGDSRLTDDEAFDVSHCVLWCEGFFYDCLWTDGETEPLDLVITPTAPVGKEKEHNEYKAELAVIAKRGNPPNLWDEAKELGHETCVWGKII